MKVFYIVAVLFFFSMLLEMITNSESAGEMGQRKPTGASNVWDYYNRQHPTVFDGSPVKKRKLDQLEEQNVKQGQPPTGASNEWGYYNRQNSAVQHLYRIIFGGPPGAAAAKKRKLDQLEVQKTKQSQEEPPKKDSAKKFIVYKRRRKGQKEVQAK